MAGPTGKITKVSKPLRQCPKCTYPLRSQPDLDGEHMLTICTNKNCDYSRSRRITKKW